MMQFYAAVNGKIAKIEFGRRALSSNFKVQYCYNVKNTNTNKNTNKNIYI